MQPENQNQFTSNMGAMKIAARYEGRFETHVTTELTTPEQHGAFEQFCREAGVGCVFVELSRGVTRVQPMTSSVHGGNGASLVPEIDALLQRMRRAGYPILRVKVEADIEAKGVPRTAEEVPSAREYFEFHMRVILKQDADLRALAELAREFDGHLSTSTRKTRADGLRERFITRRVYNVGRDEADLRRDELEAALKTAGYEIDKVIGEYTVYDSRVEIDQGWMK